MKRNDSPFLVPLTQHTVHLCVDMQHLSSSEGPWHTPWMDRVLPIVTNLAERFPERTVFTRFIPPVRPEEVPGMWRRYYERWRHVTRERVDPALLRLLDAIDHGYPVTLATDAICSPSDEGHDALLTMYRKRFGIQLALADSQTILAPGIEVTGE